MHCCRCVCVPGWQLLCPAGSRDPHLRAPGSPLGAQPAAIRCPAGPKPHSRFNQHLPQPSYNRTHQRDGLQVLACTTKIVPMSASVTLRRAYTARRGQSTYDSLPPEASAWAFGTAHIVVDASIETARVDSSAIGCCRRKASCCGAAFLPCSSFALCGVPVCLIRQSYSSNASGPLCCSPSVMGVSVRLNFACEALEAWFLAHSASLLVLVG